MKLILLMLTAGVLSAANFSSGGTPPSGACTGGDMYVNTNLGDIYTCGAAGWVKIWVFQHPIPPPPVVAAFPGAQGGGSMSVGGRGGKVFEVTNLADSGTGSLRACVEASGPRNCVFLTGGTIVLQSGLHVLNPFLTIAGQTAPGGGIQITQAAAETSDLLRIGTHDVVVRYIRARIQAPFTNNPSPFSILNENADSYNVIWDHCSAAYAGWDNWDIYQGSFNTHIAYGITLQWSILGEPLFVNGGSNNQISGATPSLSDQMTDIDVHHNLFSSGNHRNPIHRTKTGRMINNIVYNYSYYALKAGGNKDFVANYVKAGPYVSPPVHEIQTWTTVDIGTTAPPSLYISGNSTNSNNFTPGSDASQWSNPTMTAVAVGEDSSDSFTAVPIPTTYMRTTPLAAAGQPISIDIANNLSVSLIPTVGASQKLNDSTCLGNLVANRDSLDARYVSEFQNGTGISNNILTPGPLPSLAAGTPCRQSLHDGIADAWKVSRGLSLTDPTLGSTVDPATGYTYFEDYVDSIPIPATAVPARTIAAPAGMRRSPRR
jgi:hypothetical protein